MLLAECLRNIRTTFACGHSGSAKPFSPSLSVSTTTRANAYDKGRYTTHHTQLTTPFHSRTPHDDRSQLELSSSGDSLKPESKGCGESNTQGTHYEHFPSQSPSGLSHARFEWHLRSTPKPMAQSECPLADTLRETSVTSCHELPPLLRQLLPSQYQDIFSVIGGKW